MHVYLLILIIWFVLRWNFTRLLAIKKGSTTGRKGITFTVLSLSCCYLNIKLIVFLKIQFCFCIVIVCISLNLLFLGDFTIICTNATITTPCPLQTNFTQRSQNTEHSTRSQ